MVEEVNELETILATLNSSSGLDDINRAIQTIAKRVSKDDPEYEEQIKTSLSDLLARNLTEQETLLNFQRFADSVNLKPVLDYLENNITNVGSAINAINKFDLNWFQTTALSNEAKVEVAARLYNLCNKHCGSFNSFWKSLMNQNVEVMAQTSYRYSE